MRHTDHLNKLRISDYVAKSSNRIREGNRDTPKPQSKAIVGLALDLIGAIIILVDAIPYVALGDRGLLGGLYSPIFGIYGTVFAITILVFAFIGYFAKGPVTMLLGVLMALIGFVVMIAAYVLAFDFLAVFAGLIAALGGILTVPGKR
jgi:hypothetical protein